VRREEAEERTVAFSTDERRALELLDASDPGWTAVHTRERLHALVAEILGPREQPLVAVALDADGMPVLASADVRAVVGPEVAVYLLCEDELLAELRRELGAGLALVRGAVRVWWPGVSRHADACDHPLVVALEDEPDQLRLEEFALQFDLTRPHVRAHVRVIEDARTLLEYELECARKQSAALHERLRDAQIECHALRSRAR
jgi:hypothetical protein